MRDISLHVLDIAQNAVRAGAGLITICLWADRSADEIKVEIADDGVGMSKAALQRAMDPFYTGRTARRIGLGLPLLQAGAEGAGGSVQLESTLGAGTRVVAVYALSHVDRPPVGDFCGTVLALMVCNPDLDFLVSVKLPDAMEERTLDTRSMRALMRDLRLDEPDVADWLRESLQEMFPPAYADL